MSPNQWVLLASIPLLCAAAIYTWRHRDAPVSTPILLLLLVRGVWGLCKLSELWSADFESKLGWFYLSQAALALSFAVGVSILIEFIRPGNWLRWPSLLLLYAPTALIIAVILTDPVHHLVWHRFWLEEFVVAARAPLAWVFLFFYICMFLATVIALIRFALRWPVFHWQAGILLIAFSGAIAVDSLVTAGLIARTPLDPTILAYDFNLMLYILGTIGLRQVLDIVPVARKVAVEHMQDGIAVLNAQGRLVFQNPAARALLGSGWRIASRAERAGGADLVKLAMQAAVEPVEIQVESAAERRQYMVRATPLEDPRGWLMGDLLIFQDITDRIRARRLLIQQQRTLAALEERERIANELHDDLGQVLGYVKLQVQAARDLLAGEDVQRADGALSQLVGVAQEAHADVREFILGAVTVSMLDQGFLPALEEYLGQLNRNFGLRTELNPPTQWDESALAPAVALQLLRIVQEALTNARKHAHAETVSVCLDAPDGHARITIQDDGRGFEPERLANRRRLSFGLRFMHRRVESIGGQLEVRSAPGKGTQVIVQVPLDGSRS